MIAFNLNQQIFTFFGICSRPTNESFTIRCLRIFGRSIVLLITFCFGLIGSGAFVIKYISTDIEVALYALFPAIATIAFLYMYLAAYLSRNSIIKTFADFQEFYDSVKDKHLFVPLQEANKKSEKFTKFFEIYFIVGYATTSTIMATLQLAGILYRFKKDGYINADSLIVPYKFEVPWNNKTIEGWYCSYITGILLGATSVLILNAYITLFVEICLHHHAFHEQFHLMTKKLNRNRCDSNALRQLIQLHSKVRRIFADSADVYSKFIMAELISGTARISICIFHLDLVMRHPNPNIFTLVSVIFVAITEVFLYCYAGQIATESSLKFADSIFDLKWIEFPVNVQKMLIPMISYAQQPVHYHGFGFVLLNLKTFNSILRINVSYYMMFKTITLK